MAISKLKFSTQSGKRSIKQASFGRMRNKATVKIYIQTVFLGLAMLLAERFVPSTDAQIAAPVFQFAIFYNLNLEIDPGSSMTITGPVFCNQSIWEGSDFTTFSSTVGAVGTNYITANDPFAINYDGFGQPTFTLAGQPVSGVGALNLQMGTNTDLKAILKLPPSDYALGTPAAYSTNGQVYLANAADLYISNSISGTNSASPAGTNTFVFYQDSAMTPSLKLMTPDFYILKSPANFATNFVFTNLTSGGSIGKATNYAGNVRYAGYSFVTNALFYDWREGWSTTASKGKAVQAVQIDIAKFNTWLTNTISTNSGAFYDAVKVLHAGHPINSMYIYTGVPLTTTTLPAVRVVNGIQLPSPGGSRSGFTLATQFPMYVCGDYNAKDITGSALGLFGTATATIHTYPAALMADSITILSDSWIDAVVTKLPTSSSTTVNAALLTGIVPTNPNINQNYSGGVENSLRLLENWGSTLTYNGSIVAMFPSQYATNFWQQFGNYYNVPTRHWSFDFNFAKGTSFLPPLTPSVLYTNPSAIVTQPQSQTNVVGSTIIFSVATSDATNLAGIYFHGSNGLSEPYSFLLNYQWFLNGINISGATNSILALTNIQPDQAGIYSITVTNPVGGVISSNAVLCIYSSAVSTLNGVSLNTGNNIQFTVAGVPGFNYAVQASTNMIDWVPLITNISPFIFIDTNTSGNPQQFYRSLYTP